MIGRLKATSLCLVPISISISTYHVGKTRRHLPARFGEEIKKYGAVSRHPCDYSINISEENIDIL